MSERQTAFRRIMIKQSEKNSMPADTYDLNRFLKAQEQSYDAALKEISQGHKRSHWIWYIFPQMKGLGISSMSDYYGIGSLEEGKGISERSGTGGTSPENNGSAAVPQLR